MVNTEGGGGGGGGGVRGGGGVGSMLLNQTIPVIVTTRSIRAAIYFLPIHKSM